MSDTPTTAVRFTAALGPSARQDWRTPPDFFQRLNAEFRFTIDAAASFENRLVDRFWSESDSGLVHSWNGERVWCNPPYGRNIGDWTAQAAKREADVAVLLLPARSDTRWWHRDVEGIATVRRLAGRLKFSGHEFNAPFPSVIAIYPPYYADGVRNV
jgi:phage N-6-adenine-methyltransferase